MTDTLFINSPSTDVYFNLATEEFLLKNHTENIFMLWQNTPSVILGKHQQAEAEINLDYVKAKQIRIARRYSGGGTVYHDPGNLNLTFIENTTNPDFENYTRQILRFLETIGIHAQKDTRLGINIGRLKISGSAQCIYKTRVLYHCTLLYSTDLIALNTSLSARPETFVSQRKYTVASVKSPVTNISTQLQTPQNTGFFRKQVFSFFLGTINPNRIYSLNPADIAAITQLRENKYATTAWIFRENTERPLPEHSTPEIRLIKE